MRVLTPQPTATLIIWASLIMQTEEFIPRLHKLPHGPETCSMSSISSGRDCDRPHAITDRVRL